MVNVQPLTKIVDQDIKDAKYLFYHNPFFCEKEIIIFNNRFTNELSDLVYETSVHSLLLLGFRK